MSLGRTTARAAILGIALRRGGTSFERLRSGNMDAPLTLFVDEMLSDTLETRLREQDFDPAREINECGQAWIDRSQIKACRAYNQARKDRAPGKTLGRL